METLQLDKRVLVELDFFVTLLRGIKHVVVDVGGNRAYAVHTTNALHQTCGIPR